MSGQVSPEYAAGLFDGEGCVYIRKCTDRHYQLVVEVQMTDAAPIYALKDSYGGMVKEKNNSKRVNRRNSFVWYMTATDAVPFLTDILPYTLVKHDQIKLALEFQSRFQKGNTRWNKLSDSEIAIRHDMYLRLQELKRI